MLSGIILTGASIACMCGAGAAINVMLTWFNNFDYDPNKKKGSSGSGNSRAADKDRLERLGSNFNGRV